MGVIVSAPHVLAGGVGEGFAEGLLDAVAEGLGVGLVALGLLPQATEPRRARTAREANRLVMRGDYGPQASSFCRIAFATFGLAWGAFFFRSAISAPSACFLPAL